MSRAISIEPVFEVSSRFFSTPSVFRTLTGLKKRAGLKKILLLFFGLACLNLVLLAQHFTTNKNTEGIEISENGKKVFFYQQRPKSVNGKYERAGYIHPLYALHETILTEDSPEDHPYHRGIFWAWHQVIWKNKRVADGWVSDSIRWVPVKLSAENEKNSMVLRAEQLWKLAQPEDTTAIIDEHTTITVHPSTGLYRAIDFDIQLYSLQDSVQLGGSDDVKGYGGFCVRLKIPADISFMSGGETILPIETAVTAGPWMDINGSFDQNSSAKSGVAIFCNPANPGTGKQWILRKETSMQNVPYPGRVPTAITKAGWRLRYRIIIHNAPVSDKELEKLYQEYIQKCK